MPAVIPFIPLIAAFAAPLAQKLLAPKPQAAAAAPVASPLLAAPVAPAVASAPAKQPSVAADEAALRRQGQGQQLPGDINSTLLAGIGGTQGGALNLGNNNLLGL